MDETYTGVNFQWFIYNVEKSAVLLNIQQYFILCVFENYTVVGKPLHLIEKR